LVGNLKYFGEQIMKDEIMASENKNPEIQKDKDKLIRELFDQMEPIFESSAQSVILFFDDTHWACNKKFALLLGYESIEEMVSTTGSSPPALVSEESKTFFTAVYEHATKKKAASFLQVLWKKKTGRNILTYVILVPIAYGGNIFTLYFIST
jgi:hypothetical protein